ncbi:MAG: hypothetical protein RBT06_02080 [Smithellaceae bacterium]|jgi:hypothetical protein|nr:hypothetical protein [Syntrophaceae bacterium]MDX9815711.1 hypothetical protein [Smithellaceae bacterium]NMD05227.1 hypothetical protein [Deltaproteobacteria bacterium]HOM68736.1 hypothetical protein [Smithellaceae bacterium]HQK27041.1 hypothetical protein [Smithellaceae bacterium]
MNLMLQTTMYWFIFSSENEEILILTISASLQDFQENIYSEFFLNNLSNLSFVPEPVGLRDLDICMNLKKSQKLKLVLSSTLSACISKQLL